MHSFLRNVAIGLLRPERLVFKDAAPESRKPVEAPGASISPDGAFDQLMRDLDTFANALDNPTKDQIRKELEHANEANKGEIYNKICSILDPKLVGMRPELLDSVHRSLGEKIDAYVAIKEGRGARIEASRHAQISLADETEKREELNDNSPPEAYVETFKNSPKIQGIAGALEMIKLSGDPRGNFERWPADALAGDHLRVASYFTELKFPRGKGRNAFIDGFLTNDPNNENFKRSHQALVDICTYLEKYIDERVKERADAEKVKNRPAAGFTISDAANNLKDTWKQAKGWDEKGAFLVAAGAVLWMAWSMKDDNFPGTETKWRDICKYAVGFLSINYLSGKMSKDKRTLTQRLLDVMPDIDDFDKDDNRLKGFAQKHGMRENQNEFHTFLALQSKDVKTLFPLYQAAIDRGEEEISQNDIRGLGFYRGEIDGKTAFKVIDDLVDDTAINWGKAEAISSGKLAEGAELTADDKKRWTQKWYKLDAFQKKYIVHGADERGLADHAVTFGQAVQNEITIEEATRINEAARKQKLTTRGYEAGAAALTWVYDKAKDYGPRAAKATWAATESTYGWAKKNVAIPLSDWAVGEYKHYMPKAIDPAKKWVAECQEADLVKVIPAAFALEVDRAKPGSASIMGYPGIPFEVKYRKTDGKEVAIIDADLEFELDAGLGGDNVAKAATLRKRIEERVSKLMNELNVPSLNGKKPDWNATNKKWELKNIEIKDGSPALGLTRQKEDLVLSVDPDGKKAHIFLDGTGIDYSKIDKTCREVDFKNLEQSYTEAAVQKVIREDSAYSKYLGALPITNVKITKGRSYPNGVLIEGKIAGLPFQAVKAGADFYADGIDFYDGSSAGGLDKLEITATDEGRKFAREVFDRINDTPYFINPFRALQAKIENADESFYSRLEELSKGTKALGFLPANVKGALNGKILERQWEATLRFKRIETQYLFENEIIGGTADNIDVANNEYITKTVKQLENLSNYISTLGSGKDIADEFQDLLNGKADPTKHRPDGLEYMNYTNDEYQTYFKKFRTMISGYDYEGLDGLDASVKIGAKEYGASDTAYKIYETLLLVWSQNTRHLARTIPSSSLPSADKTLLDLYIQRIEDKLERAKRTGGGVIHEKDLPKTVEEADFAKWIQP